MTQPSLDEAVREHYRAASLDSDTLQTLRDQIAGATPEAQSAGASGAASSRRAADRPAASGARGARLWTRLAAGAIAVVFAGALWAAWPTSAPSAETLAQEIALNHVRALDPDVRAPSFDDLAGDLEGLDFAVVAPEAIAMEKIVGARYCSLGGEMAAQIRFLDANDHVCTLYQARDSETFRDVQEGEFEMSGVRVRVWREGGLIMGLAEPLAEPVAVAVSL